MLKYTFTTVTSDNWITMMMLELLGSGCHERYPCRFTTVLFCKVSIR